MPRIDLITRQRHEEWMDAPDADAGQLRASLGFLQRVNRWLGYANVTVGCLKDFSRDWAPGQTISILDVATGSGDIPRAIERWARAAGFNVHIVGIDMHAQTAQIAAAKTVENHSSLKIFRADARALPFADRSFDYVVNSLFLHHLSDEDAVRVLREMDRVARRGIIVSDLLRNHRAMFWIRVFSFFSNPMVRHDGPVSVGQSFTREEVLRLCQEARLDYVEYSRRFGHRFVLAGQRR
ncbi:MAG: methyltransferase domain-containing protein [Tepidisphaeraceae bacterium]|jgi:SAM-dependent methyltransferase